MTVGAVGTLAGTIDVGKGTMEEGERKITFPRGMMFGSAVGDPGRMYVFPRDVEDVTDPAVADPWRFARPAFVFRAGKWRCAGHLLEKVLWPDDPNIVLHHRCMVCGKIWRPGRRPRAVQRAREEVWRWEDAQMAARLRADVNELLKASIGKLPKNAAAALKEALMRTFYQHSPDLAASVGDVSVEQDKNDPTQFHYKFTLPGPVKSVSGIYGK